MQIENLDHLGLVAGIVDELKLVELTDEVIERHCLEHVSAGQVVKAMILNALGFLTALLYLFGEELSIVDKPGANFAQSRSKLRKWGMARSRNKESLRGRLRSGKVHNGEGRAKNAEEDK